MQQFKLLLKRKTLPMLSKLVVSKWATRGEAEPYLGFAERGKLFFLLVQR